MNAADVVRRLWAKDPALWKSSREHAAIIEKSLGWLALPAAMPGRLGEIDAFVGEVRRAGILHAVVLGMGGSSLAPEVFRRTWSNRKGFPALHVLDSTEPGSVTAIEAAAKPSRTLYIVASKSGDTVEPMRMLDYFYAKVKSGKGDKAGESFAAITDPGSPLIAKAAALGFRKTFLNFADIGGRYSALSYFGIVPAALMGVDTPEILARAGKMARACAVRRASNPGFALGAALARHAAAGRDKLLFLLPPRLASFGLWLEQLIAESTGKEGKGIVPVSGESTALTPSRDRVFVLLRLKAALDSASERAAESLKKAGHPVIVLELTDALDLGAEFFRWEVATSVLGKALGINPFDQPNVQSAKSRTKAVLAALQRGEAPNPEPHVAGDGIELTFSKASRGKDRPTDIDAALARFLSKAAPRDFAGLLAYIRSDGTYEAALESLRAALGRASGLAVQAGYGPRYLHSTGQLHKGGPDTGIFLVVSRGDGPDLDIPGAGHTFGSLVRAQALGDFQALEEAGRRAVFVRITGDPKRALSRLVRALGGAS